MEQSNNPLWALTRSLLIVGTVSITIGGGFGFVMHSWVSGIIMFFVTTVAQFAINSIVMTLSERRNKEAEFLAGQVLREASQRKLPYELNCAYCNTLNRVGISFLEENIFTCAKCNQPNKVFIQFTTARVTAPLTQKEGSTGYIDMDEDPGVSQSTINEPIRVS